jgi:O-antigen/teichoic acid export membrane protein
MNQDFVTATSESDAVAPATNGEMKGLHAGTVILAGVVAANVANYLFHFIAARSLGPASYSDVASLVALSGVIALPLGAVQIVVAREVAAGVANGNPDGTASFASRATWDSAVMGATITVILLAITPVLVRVLGASSTTAVALTAAYAFPAFVTPPLWGLAQGHQRFSTLSVAMGAPPLARLVLVAVLVGVGFGVAGAMGATFIAAVLGVGVAMWPMRRQLTRHGWHEARPSRRAFMRDLTPPLVGLLAITSLTTLDVIVAKVALTSHAAGIYGSGSLIGRLILYMPSAIVTVLLPKVSSRTAAGKDPGEIIAQSLVATLGFCVVAIVVYTAAPTALASLAFGSSFRSVTTLLPLFAVAMTGYALLNVLLAYHLGRGASAMSYLLAAGGLLEGVGFAVFHQSGHALVAVDVFVAALLLVAHEALIEPTLTRSAQYVLRRRRR